MTVESSDALSAWVQKVFDLVRDVSRDTDAQRKEINASLTELRRAKESDNRELWRELSNLSGKIDALSLDFARQAGVNKVVHEGDAKSWQLKMALVAALLAVLANLVTWYQTREAAEQAVPPNRAMIGAPSDD